MTSKAGVMDSVPDAIDTSRLDAVGVLMCVHAGANADHFDAAVTSMLSQTHPDVRLLIYCDGALTARHEVVLARLDVRRGGDWIIRGERSRGLPHGLNALIAYALSNTDIAWLARMDADDISVPDRISQQVAYLTAHQDIAAAGTWCIEFTQRGVAAFHKQLPVRHDELIEFMLYRSPLNHPTVLFRREVFERGFRYHPTLELMQDYDLWVRMVTAGLRIGNVPAFLLWFRVEEGFYARRSGLRRASREIGMRIDYARAMGKLRLKNFPKYAGLFLVRVAPEWIKRASYRYLRSV